MKFDVRFLMLWCVITINPVGMVYAEQYLERFDRDPSWDGFNNQPDDSTKRTVVQNFGYDPSAIVSTLPGAIGGMIAPDGQAAYYAKAIPLKTFADSFSASGTVSIKKGGGNLLLGFFNSNTINEWRTPNTVAFRMNGRGDFFHVHVEYATSKWRAGAGVIGRYDREADRIYPNDIPSEGVHTWSIAYDPHANDGRGAIAAEFDGQQAVCNLSEEHKADGASFDRFGLLNVIKSVDSLGIVYIADLKLNGEAIDLGTDPHWEGLRNRLTYESEEVRPRFKFGYSATHFAAGAAGGEMGGLFFRGDCRYPDRLAYYGARLDTLTLENPLHASGKLVLRRGVSDSTTLLGFFHAEHSVRVNPSQQHGYPMDFLGFAIEGPSAEGFFVYPGYRVHGEGESRGYGEGTARIYPDGTPHEWTLEYIPPAGDAGARIVLTLDGNTVRTTVDSEHLATGASFNRFGLVTPWIDGNGQVVYFDDIDYTIRQ